MIKILLILPFLSLFSGCLLGREAGETGEEAPSIQETVIDLPAPTSDEFAFFEPEQLPIRIALPSGWTFVENPSEYILWYDLGLTGSLHFNKDLQAEDAGLAQIGSDIYKSPGNLFTYCQDNLCVLQLEQEKSYVDISISDKGMSESKRSELESILQLFQRRNAEG